MNIGQYLANLPRKGELKPFPVDPLVIEMEERREKIVRQIYETFSYSLKR